MNSSNKFVVSPPSLHVANETLSSVIQDMQIFVVRLLFVLLVIFSVLIKNCIFVVFDSATFIWCRPCLSYL